MACRVCAPALRAAQVALAKEVRKPLFLHARDAEQPFAQVGGNVLTSASIAAVLPPLTHALCAKRRRCVARRAACVCLRVQVLARHAGPSMVPAVVHCFTGSAAELDALLALGVYVGITGWWVDEATPCKAASGPACASD